MTSRTTITAADLFVLLDREFRRRKPRECRTCFLQLPYRVEARGAGEANWQVIPSQCDLECTDILEDIVQQHQRRYDLA